VRSGRLWAGLLGVEKTTVERVEFDETRQLVVVDVKPGGLSDFLSKRVRLCLTQRRRSSDVPEEPPESLVRWS